MTALYSNMNANRKSMIALLLGSFLLFPIITLTSAYASNNEEEWKAVYTIGKFLYSDPPKPDQIFKIQYRVINGTTEEFNAPYYDTIGGIVAKVNSSNDGTLEVKFPRNYPYTNEKHLRDVNGDTVIIIVNNIDVKPEYAVTDCFFLFSIPFTGSSIIDLALALILINSPHRGDDVPDSCIPQTLVEDVPVRKDGTISPLHQFRAGVAAEDIVCNEGLELVIRPDGKPYCVTPPTVKILNELWNK